MRRILRTALVVLSLIAATAGTPAHAVQTSSGEIGFSGSAFLPTYPCPLGNTCTGTFVGSATGALSGVNGTVPWTATLAAAPINVSFSYQDECPLPIGIAGGSTTIVMQLNGAAVGTYGPPTGSAGLPWPVTAVRIPITFDWGRIGPLAAMDTVSSMYLTVQGMGSTTQEIEVAFEHIGKAPSVFLPTSIAPMCDAPGPLSALIAGAATIPA